MDTAYVEEDVVARTRFIDFIYNRGAFHFHVFWRSGKHLRT